MRTLLKPLAVAVLALAAVGAAQATTRPIIDNGQTGNGHLFFSVWDGVSSYTRGTNIPIDDVFSGVAAPGLFSLAIAADPLFRTWLSTAAIANIEWAATAIDSLGPRRSIETQQQDGTITARVAGDVRSYLGNVALWLGWNNHDLLTNPAFLNASTSPSLVIDSANRAYGGNRGFYGQGNPAFIGFNRHGTELNASLQTGLNLIQINANSTGTALATYAAMNDGGAAFPLRAWIDFDPASATFGQFNVAAVPEPETYAMLLAGLGLMGAIAARRRQRG
jgi:hypothetical protein